MTQFYLAACRRQNTGEIVWMHSLVWYLAAPWCEKYQNLILADLCEELWEWYNSQWQKVSYLGLVMVHLFLIWFIFRSFGSFVLHLVYLFLIGLICPSFGAFVLHLVLCSSFVSSSRVGDRLSVEELSLFKLWVSKLNYLELLWLWFICSSFGSFVLHLYHHHSLWQIICWGTLWVLKPKYSDRKSMCKQNGPRSDCSVWSGNIGLLFLVNYLMITRIGRAQWLSW